MRTLLPSIVCFLPFLFNHAAASVTIGPFPEIVQSGQSYNLSWTATDNYTYTIWLVYEKSSTNEYSWARESSLAKDLQLDALYGSYIWTVQPNLSAQRKYALFLNGSPSPFHGQSFWTQTDWFHVIPANSSSDNSSVTPSPTTTGSSQQTSNSISESHDDDNDNGHHALSGGAIAGIVIGCLVAVGLIGAAAVFFLWYRKRSGVKKREAAARASRLDPVMQESHASYEMHEKNPAASRLV